MWNVGWFSAHLSDRAPTGRPLAFGWVAPACALIFGACGPGMRVSAVRTLSLTSPSGTTLTLAEQAQLQNESTGGSGAPLHSGIGSDFYIYQPTWTSGGINRSGAGPAANGVSGMYSLGAYLDVNDGGRIKLLTVDRGNHRILIHNQIPTADVSADVVVGQTNFTNILMNNNSGVATPINEFGFNSPVHATVCANGMLFVSDSQNHRVLAYSQIPTSPGVGASFVIGQPDFVSRTANNGALTSAQRLNTPYAAHCVGGKLYILDRGNARVLVYNTIPTAGAPSQSAVTADLAIGQPNLTTVGSGAANYLVSSSFLNTPYEIGSDGSAFYIADGGNNRVLVFSPIPTTADARPSYVLGQPNSTTVSTNSCACATPTQGSMNFPNTLAFKGSKLAVGDGFNSRILFFDLPITSNGQLATHVLGKPDFITGGAGSSTQGSFAGVVKGMVFDDGYIWAGDGGSSRIQVLALPY